MSDTQKYLSKAEEYTARGRELHRQAGAEIRAAHEKGATWEEIATELGVHVETCKRLAKENG